MILILFIILWVACGVATVGITFAYFQSKFPLIAAENEREDLGAGFLFGLTGPIGLIVLFFATGFAQFGWRIRAIKEGKP